MSAEQVMLVLPSVADPITGHALTVHQWGALVDEFAARGGQELILGGAEPLGYPGFWQLVRRGQKARIGRVTACLSGNLLEPWVVRALVERHVHPLITLDSLDAVSHDHLHGAGSHVRALAALDRFLTQGLEQRTGILATVNRLNQEQLPQLAAWAAERRLARLLWDCVPDGDWPSPQLRALRLSPEEKTALTDRMQTVAGILGSSLCIAPADPIPRRGRASRQFEGTSSRW